MLSKLVATAGILLLSVPSAWGFTTSLGQSWDYEPDAWTRANSADASWFGWDVLELPLPPVPDAPFGSYQLSDSTPDIGAATTATGTDLSQSPASVAVYGHKSSSGNYYSGFPAGSTADEVISGIAPASGTGGHTTVLLQVIAQPTTNLPDLSFSLGGTWTQTSDVSGSLADGASLFWQEWTSPGAGVPFSIEMTSTSNHIAIDAFQVDTYWTPGTSPVANSLTSIGVPEPSALGALFVALSVPALASKRRRQW